MVSSEQQLARVVNTEPLNPLVGAYIDNPHSLRALLGDALAYAQPVEAEAALGFTAVRSLLPNMDPDLATFFDHWVPQELAHGAIEERALLTMGLLPGEIITKNTAFFRIVGLVANISPGFHDAAEVAVVTYAALGEKEVLIAYPRMARIARDAGELSFADLALMAMTKQEAMHLAFYEAYAAERWQHLQIWQKRLVRLVIERGYTPVGVQKGNQDRIAGFGKMLLTIEPDKPKEIALKVEEVARRIMDGELTLPGFLQKQYQQIYPPNEQN